MPESLLSQRAAARLQNNPQLAQLAAEAEQAYAGRSGIAWAPFANSPQAEAFACSADWVGYGGAAGGGKTDLMLGLAALKHRDSIIFRRVFKSLDGTIKRSREIYNPNGSAASRDRYNESLHRWRLAGGKFIQFGNLQYPRDWEQYRGNPHDLFGFDEATEFDELSVRSLAAWCRSSVPGQLCQVVLTFNPPIDEQGRWVIRFFLPWMAHLYPELPECKRYTGTPAKPGELRWYTTVDGTDQEVPEGTKGAKSRTFYPASVEDNPIYMAAGYDATLEALPEPLRSQLRHGSFTAGIEGDPWQVIPGDWVRLAQERYKARPLGTSGTLLAAALDVARGGKDSTALARLYEPDYITVEVVPGSATPSGPAAATFAMQAAGALLGIGVDVIGVGASAFDTLASAGVHATAVNFAEGAPAWARDRSGKLGFRNMRAAHYWALREALDPAYGGQLALPDDEQLYLDLTSARWSITSGGILIESKDDIIARLGRSPDRGDAVVMAYWLGNAGGTPGL